MDRAPGLVLAVAGTLVVFAPTIASASVTIVGGGTFSTLSAAVAAANPGDTLDVQAGTYLNDFAVVNVPLTIVGVGGTPIFQATGFIPNQKGILIVNADTTINNLEFTGATVTNGSGGNGAGIRYQGGNLTVQNSIFNNNQDGILANDFFNGNLSVSNSTFTNNGSGTGFTHALYAGFITSLMVTGSTFTGTSVGHDIKSRALTSTITGNTLDDGTAGATTSLAIDLPNGGVDVVQGNTFDKTPTSQNDSIISFGEEAPPLFDPSSLLVEDNIFNSTRPGSIGVNNTTDIPVQLVNNTFTGVDTPLQGPGVFVSDVPEPATLALFAFGAAGLALRRPRARQG